MARARMVSRSICTDAKFRDLPCSQARLLFILLIVNADNKGRLRGEPAWVRATAIPHEPRVTDEHVASWLAKMDALGLIAWYEHDGGQFIELSSWAKHQDLTKYGKKSDYPDPPISRRTSPISPCEVEVEVKLSEAKPSEEKEKLSTAFIRQHLSHREKDQETQHLNGSPHHPRCTCEHCMPTPISNREKDL